MKLKIIGLLFLFLLGCENQPETSIEKQLKTQNLSMVSKNGWGVLCIDNVEYIYRASGNSFLFTAHLRAENGMPYLCK